MSFPHAFQGMATDQQPQDELLSAAEIFALVKNDEFEAIRRNR